MAQTISNPAVTRITADQYIVPSRTHAGVEYSVIRTDKGWECSCPNAFAKVPNCWHLHAVKAAESKRRDNRPCQARPKAAPPIELGLYLLTGGNQGRA